jgi:hypothetical protein
MSGWGYARWVFTIRHVWKIIFLLASYSYPVQSLTLDVHKDPVMFLTVIIPGPKNPKHKVDVYLQPLISELN